MNPVIATNNIHAAVHVSSESSPLQAALDLGDIYLVYSLLDQGARLASKDVAPLSRFLDRMKTTYQQQPLTNAQIDQVTHIVLTLLTHGITISRDCPPSLLQNACFCKLKDVIYKLLEFGMQVDAESLRIVCAASDMSDVARRFLQEPNTVVNKPDGTSPLVAVLNNNNRELAHLLIDKGANIHAVVGGGWTPLLAACLAGFKDIVFRLLDMGANPTARISNGATSLICACNAEGEEHDAIIERLLAVGVDPKIASTQTTLFHRACWTGRSSLALRLIDMGVSVGVYNQAGSPLYAACANRMLAVVQKLLKHPSCNVVAAAGDGLVPFKAALYKPHNSTTHALKRYFFRQVFHAYGGICERIRGTHATSNLLRYLIEHPEQLLHHPEDHPSANPLEVAFLFQDLPLTVSLVSKMTRPQVDEAIDLLARKYPSSNVLLFAQEVQCLGHIGRLHQFEQERANQEKNDAYYTERNVYVAELSDYARRMGSQYTKMMHRTYNEDTSYARLIKSITRELTSIPLINQLIELEQRRTKTASSTPFASEDARDRYYKKYAGILNTLERLYADALPALTEMLKGRGVACNESTLCLQFEATIRHISVLKEFHIKRDGLALLRSWKLLSQEQSGNGYHIIRIMSKLDDIFLVYLSSECVIRLELHAVNMISIKINSIGIILSWASPEQRITILERHKTLFHWSEEVVQQIQYIILLHLCTNNSVDFFNGLKSASRYYPEKARITKQTLEFVRQHKERYDECIDIFDSSYDRTCRPRAYRINYFFRLEKLKTLRDAFESLSEPSNEEIKSYAQASLQLLQEIKSIMSFADMGEINEEFTQTRRLVQTEGADATLIHNVLYDVHSVAPYEIQLMELRALPSDTAKLAWLLAGYSNVVGEDIQSKKLQTRLSILCPEVMAQFATEPLATDIRYATLVLKIGNTVTADAFPYLEAITTIHEPSRMNRLKYHSLAVEKGVQEIEKMIECISIGKSLLHTSVSNSLKQQVFDLGTAMQPDLFMGLLKRLPTELKEAILCVHYEMWINKTYSITNCVEAGRILALLSDTAKEKCLRSLEEPHMDAHIHHSILCINYVNDIYKKSKGARIDPASDEEYCNFYITTLFKIRQMVVCIGKEEYCALLQALGASRREMQPMLQALEIDVLYAVHEPHLRAVPIIAPPERPEGIEDGPQALNGLYTLLEEVLADKSILAFHDITRLGECFGTEYRCASVEEYHTQFKAKIELFIQAIQMKHPLAMDDALPQESSSLEIIYTWMENKLLHIIKKVQNTASPDAKKNTAVSLFIALLIACRHCGQAQIDAIDNSYEEICLEAPNTPERLILKELAKKRKYIAESELPPRGSETIAYYRRFAFALGEELGIPGSEQISAQVAQGMHQFGNLGGEMVPERDRTRFRARYTPSAIIEWSENYINEFESLRTFCAHGYEPSADWSSDDIRGAKAEVARLRSLSPPASETQIQEALRRPPYYFVCTPTQTIDAAIETVRVELARESVISGSPPKVRREAVAQLLVKEKVIRGLQTRSDALTTMT